MPEEKHLPTPDQWEKLRSECAKLVGMVVGFTNEEPIDKDPDVQMLLKLLETHRFPFPKRLDDVLGQIGGPIKNALIYASMRREEEEPEEEPPPATKKKAPRTK